MHDVWMAVSPIQQDKGQHCLSHLNIQLCAISIVFSLAYLWDLLSAVGTVTCHFVLCTSSGIGRRQLIVLCWKCCIWVLVVVYSIVIMNLSSQVAASSVLLLLELCCFIYQARLSLIPLFELMH